MKFSSDSLEMLGAQVGEKICGRPYMLNGRHPTGRGKASSLWTELVNFVLYVCSSLPEKEWFLALQLARSHQKSWVFISYVWGKGNFPWTNKDVAGAERGERAEENLSKSTITMVF